MEITLIALATAGVLASTAAGAAPPASEVARDSRAAVWVPVQYQQHRDGWDDRSANVDEREARINARIQRGLNDGTITRREARRLHRELEAIEAKERAFKGDGRISRRESDELNRDLDRLAAQVREERRDDEQRRY